MNYSSSSDEEDDEKTDDDDESDKYSDEGFPDIEEDTISSKKRENLSFQLWMKLLQKRKIRQY